MQPGVGWEVNGQWRHGKNMCRHSSLEMLGSEGEAEKWGSVRRDVGYGVLGLLGLFYDGRYRRHCRLPSLDSDQPSQWYPGFLSPWLDACGFPSSIVPKGFAIPGKITPPAHWLLLTRLSRVDGENYKSSLKVLPRNVCFLNWVSLSSGNPCVHLSWTSYHIPPALVSSLFHLLSPQLCPCPSAGELTSTYLKKRLLSIFQVRLQSICLYTY